MIKIEDEILKLKEDRNAIILAHNYQRPEVQDIADFVGDSYGLSKQASKTKAAVIVFCGVDFMAETASILNPDKKILIPDINAQCPMAKMLSTEDLLKKKKEYPGAEVVLYINTHAIDKAYADCICTSSNAAKIVNSMDSDTVIFGPDMNLTHYIQKRTNKKLIQVPDNGLCPTHHMISELEITLVKEKYPNARLVVHPETTPDVQDLADHIASTEGIVNYCKNSPEKEFIIGTENGIIHRLEKECPGKKFYPVSQNVICKNMKFHTLEKVLNSLQNSQFEVKVPDEIAERAKKAIDRMIYITES